VTKEANDRQPGAQDPGTQPTTPQPPPPEARPAEVHADPPQPPPTDPTPEAGAGSDSGAGALDPTQPAGKVHHVSEASFKRLKEAEREKGRKEALDLFAKERGFDSAEAMQAAFDRRDERRSRDQGKPKPPQRAAKPTKSVEDPQDDDDTGGGDKHLKQLNRNMRKLERRYEESETKNADLARRMQREAAAKKRVQRERDALEAEMAVRVAAAQVGVRDTDYAMRLLTKELEGKGDDDLAKFDEASFFQGLRETHPYLFGETTQPATTGNGAGSSPGAPNPGAAQEGAAQGGKVDAMAMSKEEYRKHLRDRGLAINV